MTQEGIENLRIDPQAEGVNLPPVDISGQSEVNFYQRSGEEYKLLHNKQNLGWLGRFFGAGTSAPTNVAGVIILISIGILLITFLFPGSQNIDAFHEKIYTIITLALGYMFGAHAKPEK